MMLIIVMFNFIYSSNICFATEDLISPEEIVTTISNLIGGVVSIAIWPLRIKIVAISFIISETILTTLATADGGTSTLFVTPYEIFFNEISITDINFFNFTDGGKVSTLFREEVAKWFYFVRTVAVAILLVVLVYVGIRMAISLFADDKAKYKKMLVDWVMSLALLFVMQYIILFLIELNNVIVSALKSAVEQSAVSDFMWDLAWNGMIGVGISSITSAIVYAAVVILTLAFLISYINRMLRVGFLIIISPLITITYSLDKMKDSKSQALNTWFKELLFTILLQPFHCIIYYSYISVCFKLISDTSVFSGEGLGSFVGSNYNQLASAVLAILSIVFIRQAEKIVRTIFGFNDVADKASIANSLVMTAAVLKKAQGAGAAVRSMQGAAQNLAIGAKLKEGMNAFSNTKLGSAVSSKVNSSAGAQKVKNAVGRIGDQANKISKQAKKFSDKVRTIKNKPKKFMDNLDSKLSNAATNKSNSRFKRFTAKTAKNGLTRLRKLNSTEMAISAITAAAVYTSEDGAMGTAAGAATSAYNAVKAYKEGSGRALDETMGDSENYQKDKEELKNNTPQADDGEEQLKQAEQALETAKSNTRAAKKSGSREQYNSAVMKEIQARKALQKAREKSGSNKKERLKEKYAKIMSNGKKNKYASDSLENQEFKHEIMQRTEELIAVGKLDENQAKEMRESAKRLIDGIETNTGYTDTFSSKNVEATINELMSRMAVKTPDIQTACSAEIEKLKRSLSEYRSYQDDGYTYRKLSQFQAGGGNIDRFVDDLYERLQEESK